MKKFLLTLKDRYLGFYKWQIGLLLSPFHKKDKTAKKEVRVKEKPKAIKETKSTCMSCGNVWYYGKTEVFQSFADSMSNCGKSAMCCSGSAPAAFIPDKQVVDLNRCPKCGSRAVKKEEVIHEI